MLKHPVQAFLAASLLLSCANRVTADPSGAADSSSKKAALAAAQGVVSDATLKAPAQIRLAPFELADNDQWFPASPDWKGSQPQPQPQPQPQTQPQPAPVQAPPAPVQAPPMQQDVPTAVPPASVNATNSTTPAPEAETPRRAFPAPLDSVFPSGEYLGPTIGVPDESPIYPLTKALWDAIPELKDNNIRIYGWTDASYNRSTSKESNVPLAYTIVPNHVELDQLVLRIGKEPDTVQKDHVDWGFRIDQLFGIDYRYTIAQGYVSNQLLKYNNLYGYDPVQVYGTLYIPSVADGMVVRAGRWISPVDIEAQFSPDNYMFTHSITYTVDPYTQTGVEASIKFDNQWSIEFGVHGGCDYAIWDKGAQPTAQLLVRWVSQSNNDSLFGGINSLNNGQFRDHHDNLNQLVEVWTHRFSQDVHVLTEAYYMWQYNALTGGTVNYGPIQSYGGGGGPGVLIPGISNEYGIINNLEIKLSDSDFLSIRNEYFNDLKGQRYGFVSAYTGHGIGLTHSLGTLGLIRPEIVYERALNATPFDNGTRKDQFVFALDALLRF